MRKIIGIVAEGPREYDMLTTVIDSITGEEHSYRRIQPQPDASGRFGNGWKGVWKWCETHQDNLNDYFYSISPPLDLLVIHMDGDVARKEREVHCSCEQVECDLRSSVHPLKCERSKEMACPVELPCPLHDVSPQSYAAFLKTFMARISGDHRELPICFLAPCDSTDAWIIAACEERGSYEDIADPWDAVICHAANYNGVRITNRPKKNRETYQKLVSIVECDWSTVRKRCPQAEAFSKDVIHILTTSKPVEGRD